MIQQQHYESTNTSTNNSNLLLVLEREYLNNLEKISKYAISNKSITSDPRDCKEDDLIEISGQDIVKILNTKTDFEIVKLSTVFYIINNNTDFLGWSYSSKMRPDIEEEKNEKDIEEQKQSTDEWEAFCKQSTRRQRLWCIRFVLPFEREEISAPHYSESFSTTLLHSAKESIDIKMQQSFEDHENNLHEYQKGSLEIYYRYMKITFLESEHEVEFPLTNHSQIGIFHDSTQPYSIQIHDRDFDIIISFKHIIQIRKIFAILSHIVDIHKSNSNISSSTYLQYNNPTNGPNSTFPLVYSDILVLTEAGPKTYSLRLFSHRIELFFKGKKIQFHSIQGGRIIDKGKLEFALEFELDESKIITISFRCLNFKSKHLWFDSIKMVMNMNNRIDKESYNKEFQRSLDLFGSIDETFQNKIQNVIKVRQTKWREEVENDLIELIRIEREDSCNNSEIGQRVSTNSTIPKCCVIL